ncbi:MAG: hypothetical protein JSV80_11325 [Acidobacteriota bacterium]|nr:MAG: hypothetical protein JSV80_11325 [Acidobacteriota bacterium]
MKIQMTLRWLLAVFVVVSAGCAGVSKTRFVNPDFNFGFVERVAVIPFENLSSDRQAGFRATRLMITELLATRAIDVIEPGEVTAALNRLAEGTSTPDTAQVVALGKALNVEAVIVGSVNAADSTRSGNVRIPVVTLDVHMIETQTGAAVWAVTVTEKGGGLGARLLGTAGEAQTETLRRCVRKVVRALIS